MSTIRVELEALEEGSPISVEADGRSIAVVKWRERVYAFRNICPHQRASFRGGYVRGSRPPGGTRLCPMVDTERPVVVCPWHRWGFSLDTGRCEVDPGLRVKVYAVSVESTSALIEV